MDGRRGIDGPRRWEQRGGIGDCRGGGGVQVVKPGVGGVTLVSGTEPNRRGGGRVPSNAKISENKPDGNWTESATTDVHYQ